MDNLVDELVGILVNVQKQLHYQFDFSDVANILQHTVRKAELNGKGEAYIPILFDNELRDFVMREKINKRGASTECVGFAEALYA